MDTLAAPRRAVVALTILAVLATALLAAPAASAAATKPATPTGVKVASITDTTATGSWKAVTGATKYTATVYQGSTAVKSKTVTTVSWAVTGLAASTTYKLKVVATNSTGSSAASTAVSFTTKVAPPAKAAVSFASVTTTGAVVKFTAARATTYALVVKKGTTQLLATTVSTTSYTLSGLTAGTTYAVTVTAKNTTGAAAAAAATLVTTPTAPAGLQMSSRTNETLTVAWSATPGATSYLARLYDTGGTRVLDELRVTATSARFEDLDPVTDYLVRVAAFGPLSSGAWSAAVTVTTSPTAPRFTVDTDDVDSTTALMTWDAVDGAVSYVLRLQNVTTKVVRDVTVPANTTQYRWTGLDPASTYALLMYTFGGSNAGSSAWSTTGRFTTLNAPLVQPAPARVVSVTDEAVVLSVPSYPATGRVRVLLWPAGAGTDPDDAEQDVTFGGGTLTLRNLDDDQAYVLGVQATGGPDATPDSGFVATRFRTLLESAGTPDVDRVTSTSLRAAWDEEDKAVSYTVVVRDPAGKVVKRVTTPALRRTVTGLSPRVRYTVELVYASTTNTSSPSSRASVLTAPARKAPTGLKVRSRTTTTATLVFSKVPGAIGYTVKTSRAGKTVRTVKITTTRATVKKLKAGTRYKVTVAARFLYSETSGPSKALALRTKSKAPPRPARVKVVKTSSTSAKVTWSAVSRATTYRVTITRPGAKTRAWVTSRTSLVVNRLAGGHTYGVTVRAVRGGTPSPGRSASYHP